MKRRELQITSLGKSPLFKQWWHESGTPNVTGTKVQWGLEKPKRIPNDTHGNILMSKSYVVGGQNTVIYTDSSALCWNRQGHHQRPLCANIFLLCKHFGCPDIKASCVFPPLFNGRYKIRFIMISALTASLR